ncbi:MAG: YqaE/Pmp3 family membrane protein [Nitrospinae bacterium]|nr:YqaE/Pmp3 family membrane protein [Nitrospinota bacterium]
MDNKLIIIVAAVLLPPLAVFLKKGIGKAFILNLILTLFFFIPGIIHAVWLVTK